MTEKPIPTEAAAAEWISLKEASHRMDYGNPHSLTHWLRKFEDRHPEVSIRRVRGRIHWADLCHAFEVAANDRRNRRKGSRRVVHADA